jgi:hypothetical protein
LRQERGDVHPSFFSIGGLLARCWRAKSPITPWICASSVLTSGALWDAVRTGGPIDFIMLGLAGYELVIGLTEEPAPRLLATVGDRDLERPPDLAR